MYKHILVSTDGSDLSTKAIRTAVALASATDAKLTGVYVIAPFIASDYGEGVTFGPAISRKRYKEITEREARMALAAVEIEAGAGGARCATMTITAESPWAGIIIAAKSKGADLIVMASHGRRGLAGVVLGSETTKVLTHSTIPVLVCR
ncbi:MAG TPA: universal stress protein [Burkholderiales bacterium]|nr:universal stress protein [Burkholderiales bacterium]